MKYDEIYQQLKKLAPIPDEQWNHFETLLTPLSFNKGEYLVRAGEKSECMYIIIKGLTRSFFIDYEGKEFNKIFLAENDFASAYVELLNDIPARLSIEALEHTDVLSIKFHEVQRLYDQHLCWNIIGRKLAENFFILKEQREYEFLLMDAKQRYLNFLETYKHLKERISQYHIATYLGITPVSLSRVIKSTKK
jgi:CRP-like cAMP-binding protein